MKILVVEDDALMARAISRAIRACGHTVLVADSETNAFNPVTYQGIDLVITDWHLWYTTGEEVIEQMWPGKPFILMSGRVFDIPAAFKEKASAVMDKPFSVEEFIKCLSALNAHA